LPASRLSRYAGFWRVSSFAQVQEQPTVAKGDGNQHERAWHIFAIFLRLGLTSFGGPIAHLGYFRSEFVGRRRWLSERSYADLVALCQFLPGPASSQAGMALGLARGGYAGALAA
jgi:chromate transporter